MAHFIPMAGGEVALAPFHRVIAMVTMVTVVLEIKVAAAYVGTNMATARHIVCPNGCLVAFGCNLSAIGLPLLSGAIGGPAWAAGVYMHPRCAVV